MKVTILGTGAYGLALGLMFNKNIKNITMWTKFEQEKEMLDKKRKNDKVLPNVKMPENINFTTNLEEAVKNANLIVIAIPTAFVETTCIELKKYITKKQHVLIASKGIQQDSCLFVHEIVSKTLRINKYAVVSGPSFAKDMATNSPIGLSLAAKDKETRKLVRKLLENDTLKLRDSKDMLGIEICGAIKNVIAIASGMIYGMNYSDSTKAMFITESLHDIKELIFSLGGTKKTILSFAGFGDILLTCTSENSRNFTLGYLIGNKKSKKEIEDYMNNTTIEGLYTLKSIYKLINNKKVKIPIIDLIYDIIYKNKNPEELITFLIKKK